MSERSMRRGDDFPQHFKIAALAFEVEPGGDEARFRTQQPRGEWRAVERATDIDPGDDALECARILAQRKLEVGAAFAERDQDDAGGGLLREPAVNRRGIFGEGSRAANRN